MPRQYRLTDKSIIGMCASRGKRLYTKYLIIKILPSSKKQFAIVISKKHDKRASVRNKVKRQIRLILRENISTIQNGSYLLIVKNDNHWTNYSDIKNDLLSCLT